jgi:hypothetical protein
MSQNDAQLTATTQTGLAVQAAAAVAACRDLWDMPADTKKPCDVERDFIEAVCRFTGVTHPEINMSAWKPGDDVPEPKPDPTHGAIDDFRSALDAYDKLVFAADNDPTLTNTFTLVPAELAKKRDALIDTVPRSGEGLAALVAFVIGNKHLLLNFHEARDPSEIVRFLTTVARSAFITQAGLPARIGTPATA